LERTEHRPESTAFQEEKEGLVVQFEAKKAINRMDRIDRIKKKR
jgi:hypothetical protein